MKRDDLLKSVQNFKKINNGPKDNEKLDKSALLGVFKKNPDINPTGDSKFLNKVHENEDLANIPDMSDFWKPKKQVNLEGIQKKIFLEAATEERNNPNAFRLNLETLVLDKAHGKFRITRGPEQVFFELMYPNANGKISLKLELKDVEDRVLEVGLEDESYTKSLAAFIIKNADEMIAEKQAMRPSMDMLGADMVGDMKAGMTVEGKSNLSGFPPIWESIMAIVEADDEKDPKEDEDVGGLEAFGMEEDKPTDELGFTEDDFSLDTGETKLGGFDDFAGDFGGGSDTTPKSGGDVNKSDSGMQGGQDDEAEQMVAFRDKTDWLNDALNSMQSLVASDTATKMQSGSGVVMTQDEILNGMPGIKGDSNFEIIEKFLKIYPELDGIEMPVDMLNQIEDKLAMNDGQFDSWLQSKLPEITGATEVDETLNNEMFEDFKPMGGEPEQQTKAPDQEQSLSDFLGNIKETGDLETDFDMELKEEAEDEVEQEIKNEFPNLT